MVLAIYWLILAKNKTTSGSPLPLLKILSNRSGRRCYITSFRTAIVSALLGAELGVVLVILLPGPACRAIQGVGVVGRGLSLTLTLDLGLLPLFFVVSHVALLCPLIS